ncbi:unnamed protein product [Brassica oleracea var. botrytis]|uniref:(rape) hypothetical protein n=1 Tax=Brassica napus TaxID=3708 RepID=A0A816KAH5_BRANA|nr:unnamed protein product [Brassica napus]
MKLRVGVAASSTVEMHYSSRKWLESGDKSPPTTSRAPVLHRVFSFAKFLVWLDLVSLTFFLKLQDLSPVMTVPGIISGSSEVTSSPCERKIIVANTLPLQSKRDVEAGKWSFSWTKTLSNSQMVSLQNQSSSTSAHSTQTLNQTNKKKFLKNF